MMMTMINDDWDCIRSFIRTYHLSKPLEIFSKEWYKNKNRFMTLQDKISNDLKIAMLNKDEDKKSLLRVIIGEMNRDKSKKILEDTDVIKILRTMKENAEMLKNEKEVEILNEYLPISLSEEQIKIIVVDLITKNNYSSISDIGKLLGEIKKLPSASNIDMKLVGKLAKEILSK